MFILYVIGVVCMAIGFGGLMTTDEDAVHDWARMNAKEQIKFKLAAAFICAAWPVVVYAAIVFTAGMVILQVLAKKNVEWAKRLVDKMR